jgi:UDP-2,4-diacetamido-2,4,6-trideoxy-beta-L-altropyranose hydrolase
LSTATTISLRPARFEDADLIFHWRNDPVIVRLGSSQRGVSWNEHARWLRESLSSDQHKIFLVQGDDEAIGQIRFDRRKGADCIVSVYLAPEFTGRGWGIEAIKRGCNLIFEIWAVDRVLACVRLDNRAGQAAFRKAGFKEVKQECSPNHCSFFLHR